MPKSQPNELNLFFPKSLHTKRKPYGFKLGFLLLCFPIISSLFIDRQYCKWNIEGACHESNRDELVSSSHSVRIRKCCSSLFKTPERKVTVKEFFGVDLDSRTSAQVSIYI